MSAKNSIVFFYDSKYNTIYSKNRNITRAVLGAVKGVWVVKPLYNIQKLKKNNSISSSVR